MRVKRPTLRDVAREAGLSVTQASRALNGHSDVAEATKQRALEVAAALGYTPNLEARRLKDPDTRSGSVGLILPSETLTFSDPFFGDLLSSMVVEAAANGLEFQLSTPTQGSGPTAPYDLAIRRKRVDGFVLVRTEVHDARVDHLLKAGFPFVAFGRPEAASGFPAVEATQDSIGPAVAHLVELGHTRIACLAEPAEFANGTARLASFHHSAELHGLDVDSSQVVDAGFHEASGYDAAVEILRPRSRPTAIVALNDLLAMGALHAAADLNLSVPVDLSVVGFDDIAAARLVTPTLTTLRQSASDVGSLLVKELLVSIEAGSPRLSSSQVTPELVVRQSTGPPPLRG